MANGEKNKKTPTGPSRREGGSRVGRVVKGWQWRGGMEIGVFNRRVSRLGDTIKGGTGRRRPGGTVINSVQTTRNFGMDGDY
jgi:hypothetical protein